MLKTEAKALVSLAWPLLIAQITQVLMGVSDTIMAGQYNATDMAAVAVGFSISGPVLFFLQGLALAIPPIIARLHGAKNESSIAFESQQVGYILIFVSVVCLSSLLFLDRAIQLLPMTEALRPIARDYIFFIVVAYPGFALYQWLRNYIEGLGSTKPTMVIALIGLGINILGNYAFIYGAFGLPAMGGAGCGLASALVFYGMLIASVLYTLTAKKLKTYGLFKTLYTPNSASIVSSFKLGFPIAMTILFEVSLFAIVAVLLAPLGTVQVGAHQIALNVSTFFFMFPMSIGMAVAIRISFRLGEKNFVAAQNAAKAALIVGLIIAAFTATLTVFGRELITKAYTDNAEVLLLASHLLLFGALFQVSDAVQVVSAHALRGHKDTKAMFYITFCAYWLVGLPTGLIFGRTDWITLAPMGASGFWIGFIAGLSAAAVLLNLRLRFIQRKALYTVKI